MILELFRKPATLKDDNINSKLPKDRIIWDTMVENKSFYEELYNSQFSGGQD